MCIRGSPLKSRVHTALRFTNVDKKNATMKAMLTH